MRQSGLPYECTKHNASYSALDETSKQNAKAVMPCHLPIEVAIGYEGG